MEQTENKLEDFVSGLYLQAGISNEFTDLFDIRIHYSQAESALENGDLLNPGKNVCRFSDYALAEMIINSLGGMPAEAYFPAGFKEVLKHDAVSGVSYLETLKVFLEENMSFSSAAKRLYVHRSTLIDRVERIEKELKLDLSDPDQRLLLNMLIKAIELEKSLRSQ
jgi:DNA-binding PucR family transcriptional regulator